MFANHLHDKGQIFNMYKALLRLNNKNRIVGEKHLQLLGWQLSVRQEKTHFGQNVEEREPLDTVGGNINWNSHYGKCYGNDSENEK